MHDDKLKGSAAERRDECGPVYAYSIHPHGSPDLTNLRALAHRVLNGEGWSFNINIIVADDPELRRLNRLFLNIDETTDVIAFPEEGGDESGGDVFINLDQARVQALEAGEPVQKSLRRLVIHGILHLGGWKDDTEAERKRMLSHGESYLSEDPLEEPKPEPAPVRDRNRSAKKLR